MFNSISNNFGAGIIQFKDVQESNYIVLNAKFTCSPQDDAYKAAEVLEITVPALTIGRSTEAGVIVSFTDRREYYGRIENYDACTVAKSWVKDANTLCIEKLSVFDEQPELIFHVQTLYCQLAQGGNVIVGKKKDLSCVSEDDFLTIRTSDSLCVVFKKWAFYHWMYDYCSTEKSNADWEAFFKNLPEDINADVPVMSATNYQHKQLGSIGMSHLEEGYFTMPASERSSGFNNTANYVFSFAFLVRDFDTTPEVEGRLYYENEMLRAGQYDAFSDVNLELIPDPTVVAFSGSMGIYKAGPVTFPATDFPEEVPAFGAFFLAAHYHSKGLTVQLLEIQVTKTGSNTNVQVIDQSGDKNLAFKMFDTTVPTTI